MENKINVQPPLAPAACYAAGSKLQCQQCGHEAVPEISWLGNCGKLWRVMVWCKVCKAAAMGKTREEAEKRFADGEYEYEAA